MLSPVVDGQIVPKLVHVRHRFPMRVTILDDPQYQDPALDDVVLAACERWAEATKNCREQRFTFAIDRRMDPADADVIVQFGTAEEFQGFAGHTAEHEGWAEVRLAVADIHGKRTSRSRLSRVATHEMGHALGIWGHSPDAADVMSENPRAGEVTTADVNTLRLAYHPSNPNR